MDYLNQLILGDIAVFDELAVFTVICRIIFICIALESTATIISHLKSIGR